MRIKYNILWVDDRKDEFEQLSYDKRIIDYVSSLFFEPHLFFCETIEEAKERIRQNHFDVIFQITTLTLIQESREMLLYRISDPGMLIQKCFFIQPCKNFQQKG